MKGYVGGSEKFYFYCTFYYLLFDIVCLYVHKTSSEATTVMSIFSHILSRWTIVAGLNNLQREQKKKRD